MKNAYLSIATITIAISLFVACAENTNETSHKDTKLLPNSGDVYPAEQAAALDVASEATLIGQQQLVSMLLTAMEDSGTTYAITYCNINVGGIYDSLEATFGVDVKRVSHRPRNPANNITPREQQLIDEYSVSSKLSTLAIFDDGDHYTAYRPIRMSLLACSKCHGTPGEDIEEVTFITINMLYPDDKAIGFKYKDMRGLWRVEVPKNKIQDL